MCIAVTAGFDIQLFHKWQKPKRANIVISHTITDPFIKLFCGSATFADRYSGQDDTTSADPNPIPDRNRKRPRPEKEFSGVFIPIHNDAFLPVDRVCGRIELHIGSNQHLAADMYMILIPQRAIVTDIRYRLGPRDFFFGVIKRRGRSCCFCVCEGRGSRGSSQLSR